MENSITFKHKPVKLKWSLKQIRDRVFDFTISAYDNEDTIIWGATSVITFPPFVFSKDNEEENTKPEYGAIKKVAEGLL